MTEDTGVEIYLLSVREDGSFISPLAITHALRIVHYQLGMMGVDYHALRHTHATLLDTNGASMLDISERLGHCHMKTTKRYLHNNPALRARTRNIVESLYVKKGEKTDDEVTPTIEGSGFSIDGLVYIEMPSDDKPPS